MSPGYADDDDEAYPPEEEMKDEGERGGKDGYEEDEDEEGEYTDLILMVHGIGQGVRHLSSASFDDRC